VRQAENRADLRSQEVKRIAEQLPPVAAELMPYYEEGMGAAAAGLPLDGCRYRNWAKQSAWETGWHEGRRRAEQHEPPTPEQAKAAQPHLAALRELTEPWRDDGEPGWRAPHQVGEAHWFALGRAICRGVSLGPTWAVVPEDHPLLCGSCQEELALREAPRSPPGPARRRELAAKFKAMGVDVGE
jgi:hypothetical protein